MAEYDPTFQNDAAQRIYDRLWAEAQAAYESGLVQIDPHLASHTTDTRRGLTLVIRPDAALLVRARAVLTALSAAAPEQHLYRPDELHITALSVVGACEDFDIEQMPIEAYWDALAGVLREAEPFRIAFWGIAASPAGVMLRGYAQHDALNTLRARLRAALRGAGLADRMEPRYQAVTAHATVLRFCTQPADPLALARTLTLLRDHDMGELTVDHVDFVFNDWYMSHNRVAVLARVALGKG